MKTNSSNSFEEHGTDGQTDGIDFGLYSQRPLKLCMTRISKLKLIGDEENNIPPLLH